MTDTQERLLLALGADAAVFPYLNQDILDSLDVVYAFQQTYAGLPEGAQKTNMARIIAEMCRVILVAVNGIRTQIAAGVPPPAPPSPPQPVTPPPPLPTSPTPPPTSPTPPPTSPTPPPPPHINHHVTVQPPTPGTLIAIQSIKIEKIDPNTKASIYAEYFMSWDDLNTINDDSPLTEWNSDLEITLEYEDGKTWEEYITRDSILWPVFLLSINKGTVSAFISYLFDYEPHQQNIISNAYEKPAPMSFDLDLFGYNENRIQLIYVSLEYDGVTKLYSNLSEAIFAIQHDNIFDIQQNKLLEIRAIYQTYDKLNNAKVYVDDTFDFSDTYVYDYFTQAIKKLELGWYLNTRMFNISNYVIVNNKNIQLSDDIKQYLEMAPGLWPAKKIEIICTNPYNPNIQSLYPPLVVDNNSSYLTIWESLNKLAKDNSQSNWLQYQRQNNITINITYQRQTVETKYETTNIGVGIFSLLSGYYAKNGKYAEYLSYLMQTPILGGRLFAFRYVQMPHRVKPEIEKPFKIVDTEVRYVYIDINGVEQIWETNAKTYQELAKKIQSQTYNDVYKEVQFTFTYAITADDDEEIGSIDVSATYNVRKSEGQAAINRFLSAIDKKTVLNWMNDIKYDLDACTAYQGTLQNQCFFASDYAEYLEWIDLTAPAPAIVDEEEIKKQLEARIKQLQTSLYYASAPDKSEIRKRIKVLKDSLKYI